MDMLRFFEKRYSLRDLSGFEIELSQIVVRLEIIRLQGERLTELFFGQSRFAAMKQGCREIGSRCCRLWLQVYGDLQLLYGLLALGLGSIDETEKFVNFEALRRTG